jgi:hypothetical protein
MGRRTVDEGQQEPLKKFRLVAWLTATVLVVGVTAAGVVASSDGNDAERVVSAAGVDGEGVVVPTTVANTVVTTVPPPPPPTTVASATTTTRKPTTTAPPTTQASRTTTTVKAAPSSTTSTTAGAAASGVMLTVVNGHPMAVVLKVNDRTFTLAPGQRVGPVPLNRYAHGNDTVEVSVSQHPECGAGDADRYFPTPGNYELTVGTPLGAGGCAGGVMGVAFGVRKV